MLGLEASHHQAEFEAFAAHRALSREPAWLLGLRRDAMAFLEDHGFPTHRDEEWKHTSVGSLVRTPFRLADAVPLSDRELAAEGVDLWDGPQLVFVNGHFAPGLSQVGELEPGVTVLPLQDAIGLPGAPGSRRPLGSRGPELAAVLERELARPAVEPHGFTALAQAFWTDGGLVILDRGAVSTRPIHLVHVTVSTGEPALCAVRNLVLAGEASQGTVVETYLTVGPGKPSGLVCAITQATLADSAVVDHVRLQREGPGAHQISRQMATLSRAAAYRAGTFTLGGALVRNDVCVGLDGEGASCELSGLYLAAGNEQRDTRTVIDHAKPHGTSVERYKGIVDGAGSGTFSGKIIVREGARGSDARQGNHNLQLSRAAVINTKPQLEIYNDDVRCSHGASVGQLDEDALFYLRSRGIGLAEARALLAYGFAAEVVATIKVPAVRAAVSALLQERLPLIAEEVPG